MDALIRTQYVVQLTCAEPERMLTRLSKMGATIRNVKPLEMFKVQFEVDECSYAVALQTVDRCGGKLSVVRMRGPAVVQRFIRLRFVLVVGVLIMLVLTMYIPSRIFFISVEGNSVLGAEQILQCAEECGLLFGVSRKDIRSEQMKNALLDAMPELKWVGVNTYGCHAVISVLERDLQEEETPAAFGGIYAARDGIISSITAIKGTPLCTPGQAVSTGQLLISGYTDTGLVVRAEAAEGEVRAVTQHQMTAYAPCYREKTSQALLQKCRWSLQIGKKRINLYFNSGNFDMRCGKIYKIYDLTLPGGFRLPFSLIRETVMPYGVSDAPSDLDVDLYKDLLDDYLTDTMVAGKILKASATASAEGDFRILNGTYICEEMIGKLQHREIE